MEVTGGMFLPVAEVCHAGSSTVDSPGAAVDEFDGRWVKAADREFPETVLKMRPLNDGESAGFVECLKGSPGDDFAGRRGVLA